MYDFVTQTYAAEFTIGRFFHDSSKFLYLIHKTSELSCILNAVLYNNVQNLKRRIEYSLSSTTTFVKPKYLKIEGENGVVFVMDMPIVVI